MLYQSEEVCITSEPQLPACPEPGVCQVPQWPNSDGPMREKVEMTAYDLVFTT